MTLDKEKLTKAAVLFLFLFFAANFCIEFFYFKTVLPISSFGIFLAVVLWVILEAYLRIQHNVDKKIRNSVEELSNKISDGIDNIRTENLNNFFLAKTNFEFKLLNLKYSVEANAKSLEEIRNIELDNKKNLEIFQNALEAIKTYALKPCPAVPLIKCLSDIYATEEQKKSLLKLAPDVFSQKTVLYIGANPWRTLFIEEFFKNGCQTTVLEIFKQNAEYLRNCKCINEVIEGDVRTYNFDNKFDVVFWWHGPEHISEQELGETLKKLEKIALKMVVLGCPWGKYEQGAICGNIYEAHLSEYYEGYFEKLGYKVDYFGRRSISDSNICAVKYTMPAALIHD